MDKFGNKTNVLRSLSSEGFNVPKFIGISTTLVEKKNYDEIGEFVLKNLDCSSYAIRSSALIEDSVKSSYAGQFSTKLDVKKDQILDALRQVIAQAKEFLEGDLSQFSIIAQEYIDADKAGIIFTRNPLNSREIVVEYSSGPGEKVVGGKIKPKIEHYYWNEAANANAKGNNDLLEQAKKIEKLFNWPQDIEWCRKGDALYILQARPITTIIKDKYDEFLLLDEILPKHGDFLYEKTEISEIASRPTEFTKSLLNLIYKDGGPVNKIYSKYNIKYKYTDFLKIIGNELYVDREKEIKTLLPSYSYFRKNKPFTPHFSSIKGLFTTIKNTIKIHSLKLNEAQKLHEDLKEKLLSQDTSKNIKEGIEKFLSEYELIFEINLLADKAIKKLDISLSREKINTASILGSELFPCDYRMDFNENGLKGNSLEISDESEFIAKLNGHKPNKSANEWFKSLNSIKQKYFEKIISNAQKFNILRECGRWLTVKNISTIRKLIGNDKNTFNMTVQELIDGKIDQKEIGQRREVYNKYLKYTFDNKIVSRFFNIPVTLQGVSGGKAHGKLVTIESESHFKDTILYTKILNPELVKYFGKIKGIISENGGLLSHLAIMARESSIPVIVGIDLKATGINIGDNIEIDGDTGEIKLLSQ